MLVAHHSDNLKAIYGIGSFFDKNLPSTWIRHDIDLILVVKSIENIPKEDWDNRFYPRQIEGYEVFIGYNTIEIYHDKQKFHEVSGANYKWALIEIKYPENSKLLYGKDIRDQLPDVSTLTFDCEDILARGLYHLEKSLKSKEFHITMRELSKAIFKTSFYICVYFMDNFNYTSLIEIGKKLKDIIEIVGSVKDIEMFFEEAITYRTTGQFKTNLRELQREFISFIINLLKTGFLHKRFEDAELKIYLTKYFGGFPNLIRTLKEQSLIN